MKITCKYCGIVDRPHKCPQSKRKTDRDRIDNKVYESKEYRSLRKEVLEDFNHVCLWNLYIMGRAVKADVTHHIIEIIDDETKAIEYNNLIPLQEIYSHKEIHKLYKINTLIKKRIQKLLIQMRLDYLLGDRTLGKYKDELEKILSPPTFKIRK